ncbi:MAG TPA: DUF3445 domain-containing protein [Microbacterium sp.]|nr:DUF3445 domain-containing protein [Microbacterium sp.]
MTVITSDLSRFPFPFRDDAYRYSTNVEPALVWAETATGGWGDRILDIDDHYAAELAERSAILAADPTRAATSPHMRAAEWDALMFCLQRLAVEYPDRMTLHRENDAVRWSNALTGDDVAFTIGDDASVPGGPLRFLATQMQEDVALLDQREDALWLDAGVITFAADWSMGFDVGMRFLEIHGPVPRVHEEQIIVRAHQFLLRLQPAQAYRRTNWTMTVGRRLDTSTETYPEWGPDRTRVLDDPALPDLVHLRVEVQHLIRLPHSGAVMFLIRSYLEPLRALANVPPWRDRLAAVLRELPDDMAEYKGIDKYRLLAADWLDGRR